MRSKVLVLALVLALVLGGCQAIQTGTQAVETVMCNPPANVVAVVKAALPVLETIIAMLVPGTAAFMVAAQQINVVDTITSGGCIASTQLNALITYLQSPTVAKAQAKMMAGKKGTPVKALDISALQAWAKKGK